MRVILGPNNTLVINGVTYPLQTPSARQSGLKFNWHQTLTANGAYTVWIDFDAGRSIVTTGNGSYILKPVIRTFSELTNGQIIGYVMPQAAQAMVHVLMLLIQLLQQYLPVFPREAIPFLMMRITTPDIQMKMRLMFLLLLDKLQIWE